jgi:anhydro-N-acetylmuramic acid kinase
MSGTSGDGIDAVLAEIGRSGAGLRVNLIKHLHLRFSPALQRRILHAGLNGHVAEICELNFELGELLARAALKVMAAGKVPPGKVYAIGSHGQTVHHLPNARFPSTLQIGEGSVIARRTGVTTISDFRVADMAAGGQGAPLVPYADWFLFSDARRPRVVQNIGGIGNLTFLRAKGKLSEVTAFDTGPGNMVIDALVNHFTCGKQAFDRDGRRAGRGRVSEPLLREMLKHPYIHRRPPKTTGREEFGDGFARSILDLARKGRVPEDDAIATVTYFTCRTMADAYERHVIKHLKPPEVNQLQVIVGGGGAKNPVLMAMFRKELNQRFGPGLKLLTHEDFGIRNEAKEALAFAIMAFETMRGQPSNVPSATGAKAPAILGKVSFASH